MAVIRLDRRRIPDDARLSQWLAPDGWALRRFDWPAVTAETRGSLLFLAGRGDIIANELPAVRAARHTLLTHDADRYADEVWWHGRMPALRLGAPSWGWVAEAFASTNALARDPRIVQLDLPILMLVADADRLVRSAAAIAIAAKLPDVELIRFGRESAHEILRENDAVRDRALDAIDTSLDARAMA